MCGSKNLVVNNNLTSPVHCDYCALTKVLNNVCIAVLKYILMCYNPLIKCLTTARYF